MIVNIDFVCQRYGILPSKLLAEGTSLDMIIADAAQTYHNHIAAEQEKQHQAGAQGLKPAPKLSTEEMQAMIERTRNNPLRKKK